MYFYYYDPGPHLKTRHGLIGIFPFKLGGLYFNVPVPFSPIPIPIPIPIHFYFHYVPQANKLNVIHLFNDFRSNFDRV